MIEERIQQLEADLEKERARSKWLLEQLENECACVSDGNVISQVCKMHEDWCAENLKMAMTVIEAAEKTIRTLQSQLDSIMRELRDLRIRI